MEPHGQAVICNALAIIAICQGILYGEKPQVVNEQTYRDHRESDVGNMGRP